MDPRGHWSGGGRGPWGGMAGDMWGGGHWRGPMGMGGSWGGGRRRMRRGDMRRAVLSALVEGPGHGYEVMHRLEVRSGGLWRPSPGSVYPTLQMLEDEGMVHSTEQGGVRTYELTDAGRADAAAQAEGGESAPWESGEGTEGLAALRQSMGQLLLAAKQVAMAGSPAQIERAVEIAQQSRRDLYQLLAED